MPTFKGVEFCEINGYSKSFFYCNAPINAGFSIKIKAYAGGRLHDLQGVSYRSLRFFLCVNGIEGLPEICRKALNQFSFENGFRTFRADGQYYIITSTDYDDFLKKRVILQKLTNTIIDRIM